MALSEGGAQTGREPVQSRTAQTPPQGLSGLSLLLEWGSGCIGWVPGPVGGGDALSHARRGREPAIRALPGHWAGGAWREPD